MVVCYSHSLLPLCQLTLTSPLARGDILSCSATVCLCADFLFRFVCRFRLSSPCEGRGTIRKDGGGVVANDSDRRYVSR